MRSRRGMAIGPLATPASSGSDRARATPRRWSSSSSSSPAPEDGGAATPTPTGPKPAREGRPVRYSCRVEYDGTEFRGFQFQTGGRTVQGELERALAILNGGRRIRIDAAGRTD